MVVKDVLNAAVEDLSCLRGHLVVVRQHERTACQAADGLSANLIPETQSHG
eukprot:CAMPEP_0172681142 /NCGR_PEP_ID=MMETSP1074-20121228/17251_1 /TAXON_ID=2916 /ORGANISM="Ceratium fusus, Strain PA161109" /LENGTH=50 /DNA_ID=CAMNT_0013499601 /DNA_START=469 /DNA_END=618 /DNA_ORIENTATION=-